VPIPADPKKTDEVLDAIIAICDVQHRQIIAIANTGRALKSNAPAVFSLPDPPDYLLKKLQEQMAGKT